MTKKIKCALIGPGNIGTDLLAKLQRSPVLEPVWMVGIDPESDGLKRAREMGIKTTSDGVDGLVPHMVADGVQCSDNCRWLSEDLLPVPAKCCRS